MASETTIILSLFYFLTSKNIGYMRRTNTTQNTILFLPARKYIPVVLAAGKKDILPYAISLSKEMTDMNLRNALNVLQKGM